MIALGIDLGGTSAKIGLVDGSTVAASVRVETRADSDYDGIVADLIAASKELIAGAHVRKLGIGSPGLIDPVSGRVRYSNNIRWNDAPLRDDLARALRIPALIANDAQCAALGEALFGAGKGYRRVMMLTLGTGVGGGLVVDGRLADGQYGHASAIFGHMTLYPQGKPCTCGRKGCLEQYCSATALAERAKPFLGPTATAKTLFDAAQNGSAEALRLVDEFATDLGTAVTSLANILRPECVVIGGGVAAGADLFLPKVAAIVARETYGAEWLPVRVRAVQLGNNAGIVGAANLR